MLRVEAVDSKGQRLIICPSEKIVIRSGAEVPADIFEGVFVQEITEELAFLKVFRGDTLIFEGVVDEQITTYSERVYTQVVARSYAALLLDNEAVPQSFVSPDFEVIFKRYLEPLGFEGYEGENIKLKGEFKVTKGMSCYKVLENFLSKADCPMPHIRGRKIDLTCGGTDTLTEFSDKERAGTIRYTSLKDSRRRCELLSEIRVRTGEESLYPVTLRDEDASDRGIVRVRYLNSSMQGGIYKRTAESMMKKARQKEQSIVIECIGCLTHLLSCPAKVTRGDRVYEGCFVGELTYTLSKNDENTRITLLKL